MDKSDLILKLALEPNIIERTPVLSSSGYLQGFDQINISNLATGFVQCRVCGKIVRFDRHSWRNVIYHSQTHNVAKKKPGMNIESSKNDQSLSRDGVRDYAKGLTLGSEENQKRLKRVWKSDGKFAVKKVLFKRTGKSGKQVFVEWKYHPNSSCWMKQAWRKSRSFPSFDT